jgi:hypothetical protein
MKKASCTTEETMYSPENEKMIYEDDLFLNVKNYSTYIRVPQSSNPGCSDVEPRNLTSVLPDEAEHLLETSYQILNWFIWLGTGRLLP